MSYNYSGSASAADFVSVVPIVKDGEFWQFGDPTSGAGGYFAAFKRILDQLAWLKANDGELATANVWTARQHFNAGANIRNATLQIDGTGDIGVGDTEGSIDIHQNCDVWWQSGARGTVKSGATFIVKSGATFTVEAGSTALVQFNACTVDGVFTLTAAASATLSGPITRSGNSAVAYQRHGLMVDGASVHLDCTNDEWRIPDVVAADRVVLVDAPPDPTKFTMLLVERSPGADTHQITLRQGTGCADAADIAFGNPTGHASVTEIDGSTNQRWSIWLVWSPSGGSGATKWRIGPLGGALAPAVGAI